MKTQLLALLTTLVLTPATAFAQTATDPIYTAGFNNFGVKSELGTKLGDAISADPKAYCNDTGLGNNTMSSGTSGSNYDKGSNNSNSSGSGSGGIKIGVGSIGGSGKSNSSSNNTWDVGGSNSMKTISSTVVQGKDCSELVKGTVGLEMNRINNETSRYDIDKRHQVAMREIEAGQVQSVFGNGARSMLGDFGR